MLAEKSRKTLSLPNKKPPVVRPAAAVSIPVDELRRAVGGRRVTRRMLAAWLTRFLPAESDAEFAKLLGLRDERAFTSCLNQLTKLGYLPLPGRSAASKSNHEGGQVDG